MEKHELLLRQVHPDWIQNGVPSSQAFKPTKKDAGNLSVYQGSKISPEDAYSHYTEIMGYASDSVWGINPEDCASVALTWRSAPSDKNPAHAVIDFNGKTRSQIDVAAKSLRRRASDRGCLYRP